MFPAFASHFMIASISAARYNDQMLRNILFAVFALLMTSCSPACRVAGSHAQACITHTVQFPGETLTLISLWYAGSTENWRKIAAQNRAIVPEHLKMGDTISVPTAIAVRTEAMPKRFVQRALAIQHHQSSGSGAEAVDTSKEKIASSETSLQPDSPPADEGEDKLIRALLGE